MSGETVSTAGSSDEGATTKSTRVRSTVEFPYSDLADAEKIALAVRDLGATACEWDQLAAHLKFAPKGGGFRLQMIGAKTFNLVSYERGEVKLTDIGIRIVDRHHVRGARFDSFMSVALYRQAFEQLNGQSMPPPAAIERLFENLGVAPKQKDKARQVFMRSARHAGLFEISADRMTKPTNLSSTNIDPGSPKGTEGKQQGNGNGGVAGSDSTLHPFIRGLLDKLPTPETDWPTSARIKWLQTAANIFDLMYATPGQSPPQDIEVREKLGSTGKEE